MRRDVESRSPPQKIPQPFGGRLRGELDHALRDMPRQSAWPLRPRPCHQSMIDTPHKNAKTTSCVRLVIEVRSSPWLGRDGDGGSSDSSRPPLPTRPHSARARGGVRCRESGRDSSTRFSFLWCRRSGARNRHFDYVRWSAFGILFDSRRCVAIGLSQFDKPILVNRATYQGPVDFRARTVRIETV